MNIRAIRTSLASRTLAVLLAVGFATSGCATLQAVSDSILPSVGAPAAGGVITGFPGAAIADEPQAALAARTVLLSGGSAADAAVAAAFTLTVTLPSRASLGAGGACIAYAPESRLDYPEAILFAPPPGGGGGDRPAAVPMLARGMFALHNRYGRQPFESLILPAEQLARSGALVSRAFAQDLAIVAGPLAADPDTAAVFLPGARTPREGDTLLQPDLGATIGQLRTAGVGDLHQGGLARRLAETSIRAGGGITPEALRAALPSLLPAPRLPLGGTELAAFLPTDGGVAAAGALRVLTADPAAANQAAARAAAMAAAWRRGAWAGNAQAAIDAPDAPPGSLPPLPASTGFVTMDRQGNAVACVLTMNNLFGTGRVAPQTGILLAASPDWMTPPLLAAAIAYDTRPATGLKAAATGTGQDGAALALAVALQQSRAAGRALPNPVPDPGRANIALCPGGLPRAPAGCTWATDPRGHGLAVGGIN